MCYFHEGCPTPEDTVRIIVRIASDVGRRFPRWIAQQLDFESIDHVLDRLLCYDPTLGRFEDWCRCVLLRLAIDIQRRRRVLSLCKLPEPVAPVEDEDTHPGRPLRPVLDRLAAAPHRMGVDPYAILLLHLRLTAARRVAPLLRRTGQLTARPSILLADHLVWTDEDDWRQLAPDLPPLGEVWTRVAPVLDRPPYRLTGTRFARLLDNPRCNRVTWGQWCYRSCRWAQNRLGRWLWDQHLGPMLGNCD